MAIRQKKIGSYEAGKLADTLGPLGVPFWGLSVDLEIRQLDCSGKMTTGGYPATSGATSMLSVLSAPG